MLLSNSQCSVIANVKLVVTNTSSKTQKIYHGKNRVTTAMLYGMGEFLIGTLQENVARYSKYIPNYVLFGADNGDNPTDSARISDLNAPYSLNKAIQISSPVHEGVRGDSVSTQAIFSAHIPPNTYGTDETLAEVGLFSASNSLLARVVLMDPEDPTKKLSITQGNNEMIDVQWTIIISSII